MPNERELSARAALEAADRAGRRTREATSWYATYLLATGLLGFTWILVLNTVAESMAGHLVVGAAVVAAGIVLERWARAHAAHPRGATRRRLTAMVVWFGSYLFVVGPLVRWQAGNAVAPWAAASALMASPFLVAALLERRRS
ncbi:MAG: hypothetical protein S0880_12525 [Actinomycetota bacterium]|nr:hypothetical protein [Actinomycetota bacterium]